MSALPPKADMCSAAWDVGFGPIADIGTIAAVQVVTRSCATKSPDFGELAIPVYQLPLTHHAVLLDDDVVDIFSFTSVNFGALVPNLDFNKAPKALSTPQGLAHNHRHRECSMQKQTFAPTKNVCFTLIADIQHGQRHVGVGQKRTLE